MHSIPVGSDSTDHIAFFCPICDDHGIKKALKIKKLETEKVLVSSIKGTRDKCTWIHFECEEHGYMGWRKFYWTSEDGSFYTKPEYSR